jgi:hypothetical protein
MVASKIRMSYQVINFQKKFDLIAEHWAPKVIAEMNDYQFKARSSPSFFWRAFDRNKIHGISGTGN